MGRILSKAMRGAAQAGVPMLMEKHRSDLLAIRDKRLQQYQTSERLGSEKFQAAENEKDRKAKLEAVKNKGTATGKVPEYEKVLTRMASETQNSSLGDAFQFEDNKADIRAELAKRSVEIYKSMDNPDTTVAHEMALKELREKQAKPTEDEALAQAKSEAGDRTKWTKSEKEEFDGLSKKQWITNRAQQILKDAGVEVDEEPNPFDLFDKPAGSGAL